MNRKFKALGLALVAIFAMSAIAAQAAQAENATLKTFPTQEHAILKAEADPTEPNQVFTATPGGFAVTCKKLETETTVNDKATEISGRPIYTECSSSVGGATVTTANCSYTFNSATDANGMAKVNSNCTSGKIEISTGGCIIRIDNGQTLNGVSYTNIQTGAAEKEMHVTVNATVTGIHFTTNGSFACFLAGVPSPGTEGTYNGKATVKGFEDVEGTAGNPIGITNETRGAEMP